MIFDGTHKLIGKGAQADVFLYKGFAYKVYKPTYPAEWISFEKKQQHEVNKAGLCSVRYYDTYDDHIIKMDLIDGEMLETKINDCAARKPVEEFSTVQDGFSLLSTAFKFVHKADITGLEIPRLTQTAGLTPALFDYACTYVIFEEFSAAALVLYKALVLPDLKELSVSDSDFEEALEVCRVLRQLEKN